MSGWTEIRAKARADVHRTFELEAYYFTTPDTAVGTRVSVRVHGKYADQGAFNHRDGYAQINEEIEKIIFTQSDYARLGVNRGGAISLVSDGRKYILENRLEANDDFAVVYQVVRLN